MKQTTSNLFEHET